MKFTDDYMAKIKIWAAEQRVVPTPPGPKVPNFSKQSFSSHAEMNAWKLELLKKMAEQAQQ